MSPYSPIALANIAFTGFSAVSAVLLFLAYALLINVPGKSVYSVSSCAALLAALALIQIGHLQYFLGGPEPLATFSYRLGLFVAPSMFYFFGRWAILPGEPFRPIQLTYLLPILLLFIARLDISLPILFAFGAGNSLWLGYVVYGMRDRRKQFRFEFFYLGVMSVFAIIVLGLGFALPRIDHDYFYGFYSNAIGLAFAITIVALVANPDLIGDLFEAARVKYGASTLRDVDVEACVKKLERLMTEAKTYANENLSLSSLAGEVEISSHQLSELINTRLGMGFARYVRECRVKAAKALLISAPSQSILSISMDTGFRSQSAFYAAFKEVTGKSPGDYRKTQLETGRSRSCVPE
ncbi:MAG: helix-turn-helix domain-containing protein [Steroidobacteraceae bacterium]